MKFLIFIISVYLLFSYQTERYYIVKVKGGITNVKSGKTLAQGDEINPNDQIKFSDGNAMALVVSDANKKYTLKLPNTANNVGLTASVTNSLIFSKTKRTASRGIITNAAIKDLKEFLGNNQFTVIGNSLEVKLSKQTFENQSIEAKYDLSGKPFNKEIARGDTILKLSRADLGAKSSGEVKLYHVDFYQSDKSRNRVDKITRLDLNFVDENAIKDELKTIIGVYKKKNYTKPDMKAFLMEYFIDFYGNTHEYILSQFIDKIIEENMK